MSDDDIRGNEERLHRQFEKYADAVAVVQSVWIYGTDGRTLVSSKVHPPPSTSFLDRDFFQAHLRADAGTYYGQVYNSSFNGEPFFTVSQRLERDGQFVGVLEVSVLPSNFVQFYSTLAYTTGPAIFAAAR